MTTFVYKVNSYLALLSSLLGYQATYFFYQGILISKDMCFICTLKQSETLDYVTAIKLRCQFLQKDQVDVLPAYGWSQCSKFAQAASHYHEEILDMMAPLPFDSHWAEIKGKIYTDS